MKKKKWNAHQEIFLVLIILAAILGILDIAKVQGLLIPQQPGLQIEGKIIMLNSLSLEQKIAQMIIVHGSSWNMEAWKRMGIGGIHFFAKENEKAYRNIITRYQKGRQIPFFVTADFEGCLNPFANFKKSTFASEITTEEEAFQKGSQDGQFLRELGFSINFAPVVDLDDQIWKCRSFPGNETEVSKLAEAYISGLQQQQIIATAKHYPGKTLVVKDPHKNLVTATIDRRDLYPYDYLFERGDVASVMVSHVIASGEISSNGVPSVTSVDVLQRIKKEYAGLIISDEIQMMGVKGFYNTLEEMYVAVFKAGNDLILNFDEDPLEVHRMIKIVKEAVESGNISKEQIDGSVRKILEAKGFIVQ